MAIPRSSASRRVRLAALALVLALVVGACGDDPEPVQSADPEPSTTTTAEATTTTSTTQPTTTTTALPPNTHRTATSTVQGVHEVLSEPDGEVVASLPNPWLGTSPLVFLVKRQVDDEWYEVYLPIRPNGSSGYVKASDVDIAQHTWRIEVRLSEFRLIVTKGDEVFLDTQIAVAADNTPTPGGLYYTTELRGRFDPNNAYGTYAYGLSGYSEVLTSFAGGPGQLGIHGTNQPELIGTKVSHGCIRMRNEDVERLAPVLPLGVPVEVIP
jgi:lipoprotein-anchoring transpeptidase ErfK/SrfK